MVMHIYQYFFVFGISGQYDFGSGFRELEGVMQQVSYSREKQIPVGIHSQAQAHHRHRKFTLFGNRCKAHRFMDLVNEALDQNEFVIRRQPGSKTGFGQRSIDDFSHANKASVQNCTCCPAEPNLSGFDDGNGMSGSIDMNPQFMYQSTQAVLHCLLFPVIADQLALMCKFSDSICHAIVQAAVKGTKFISANLFIHLDSNIGNRLTEVTVVMNNLFNCKTVVR